MKSCCAASLITILRLAGHKPKTLLSDFKDKNGTNIEETLKNFLINSTNVTDGKLTGIANPHLALVIQAVISLCQDPRNFSGYDLIPPLLSGFASFKIKEFNDYFGYSLAVIALYNAGHRVPDDVVRELLNGANRTGSVHSSDTDSLILQALSCITNSPYQNEVHRASERIAGQLIRKQNKRTGAFGNQYSTAHVIMV